MNEYNTEDLVRIAKRDGNKKRPYLLVNPLQGKHIPVSPQKAVQIFFELSELLTQKYVGERLLVIGFAETATAIGAAIATNCPLVEFYIHTTREDVEGVKDYLYFSEVHSHATEQKLATDQLAKVLNRVDRVIFAEDEVTTGNTIRNLIRQMKLLFPVVEKIKFGMISIINSMEPSTMDSFNIENIDCLYLKHIAQRDYEKELDRYLYEPADYHIVDSEKKAKTERIYFKGRQDSRVGVEPCKYLTACENLAEACVKALKIDTTVESGTKILVLGTEEFMFPALLVAKKLEELLFNCPVRFHATTRSPILPSLEPDYPLRNRVELHSVYESGRKTYLYNLAPYDFVIWLHDSRKEDTEGIGDLVTHLQQAGCMNIVIVKWED